MCKTLPRLAAVIAGQVLAFELLQQVSVHWRESTQELLGMIHFLATLVALGWAVSPAFVLIRGRVARVLLRMALASVCFVALFALDGFYYWHLRPNLGLYEESDWVQQHPGFQRELRARIEANQWHRPTNAEPSRAPE